MDNRENIMAVAEDLFYSKGYEATGVQEIVNRAGITKPTLYYYYGSKRGLLDALLNERTSALRQRFLDAREEDVRIQDRLHAFAETMYEFFSEEPKFYMLFMTLFYSARESEAYQVVLPYWKDFYNGVLDIFESSAKQLGNMNGRQAQFSISLIGAINHYLLMCGDFGKIGEEKTREELGRVVDQFMYGIFS